MEAIRCQKRGQKLKTSFMIVATIGCNVVMHNHAQINFDSGTPRPLGVKGKEVSYQKGFVIDAEENREVEFKSLTSAQRSSLPWKIMEKAKKFICACLNADSKGIIYFGVGDTQVQSSNVVRFLDLTWKTL